MTGTAVPTPKRLGSTRCDPLAADSGTSPPKKRPAETGQNERANTTPRTSDHAMPPRDARSWSVPPARFSDAVTSTRPTSTMPTRMRTGPRIWFRYLWRNRDTSPLAIRPTVTTTANATYAAVRPTVYKRPDRSTCRVLPTRRPMNEIAAIFEASGHGLILVRMPSQRADPIASHGIMATFRSGVTG